MRPAPWRDPTRLSGLDCAYGVAPSPCQTDRYADPGTCQAGGGAGNTALGLPHRHNAEVGRISAALRALLPPRSHYLGYTENLEARLAAHRAGNGSPLAAAAVRDGIGFQLAATWPGGRTEERVPHRYRNSPRRLCPICRATQSRQEYAFDEDDQKLVDALVDLGDASTLRR
jgi:hypothetical protein